MPTPKSREVLRGELSELGDIYRLPYTTGYKDVIGRTEQHAFRAQAIGNDLLGWLDEALKSHLLWAIKKAALSDTTIHYYDEDLPLPARTAIDEYTSALRKLAK